MTKQPPWEEIEHTADLALCAWGKDRRALFQNAAFGLAALLGGESDSADIVRVPIELEASEWEILLYGWLKEVLDAVEEHGLVLTEVSVRRIRNYTLNADIAGHPDGRFSRYIKAVTFHNLAIKHARGNYEATIVFDV